MKSRDFLSPLVHVDYRDDEDRYRPCGNGKGYDPKHRFACLWAVHARHVVVRPISIRGLHSGAISTRTVHSARVHHRDLNARVRWKYVNVDAELRHGLLYQVGQLVGDLRGEAIVHALGAGRWQADALPDEDRGGRYVQADHCIR